VLRYVLANIAAPILSFLGQQPQAPSWGSVLNTARTFVAQAPWMAINPGIVIFALVLAFDVLGDVPQGRLDPREG
jgi:peptide/nickel transport system permease protein